MYQLELQNITMDYGNTINIIDDFSMEVRCGEIFTLLGPSGCGKSTLLRLIAGLETPKSGTILINGEPVFNDSINMAPETRKIGFVFQDYALFPHLSIYENIVFPISHFEKKVKRKKVKELLELVDLEGYEKRYPHELSGGQQQRVALARALANNPSLLLLDEPFSNLDTNLREKMRNDIYTIIKETGTTAIFVTHDQSEALSLSDTIAYVENGKVLQIGSPNELYWEPLSPRVASFMGKTNFIKTSIDENYQEFHFGFDLSNTSRASISTILCLRPELITISSKGKYKGIVQEFSFVGHSLEVTIEFVSKNNDTLVLKGFSKPFNTIKKEQEIYFDIDLEGIIFLH